MGIKLGVQATQPRRAARKMQQSNVPAESKIYLAIPLLNNFIFKLEIRFNDLCENTSKLLFLEAFVTSKMENPNLSPLDDFYTDVLANKHVHDLEFNF